MEGLIVVHTEIMYLDPNKLGEQAIKNNRRLFRNIAVEIGRYLQNENQVYYLAGESASPDSRLIYPAIRQHSSRMIYIPRQIAERQFLVAKERIIADGLDRIEVCGVAYQSCVRDMCHLLLGEEGPDATKRSYQNEREKLGWTEEKFEQIFNTRLNAHIREELTDKRFW